MCWTPCASSRRPPLPRRMRERSGLLKEAWYAAARSPELTIDTAARTSHPRAAPRALAIRRPPCRDGRSLRPSQRGAVEGCGLRRQARVSVSRLGLRPRGALRRGALERIGCRAAAVRRPALPHCRAPRARLGVDGRHDSHARAVPDAVLGHARLGNVLHGHGVSERGDAPRRELHGRAAHDLRARGLVPSTRAQARSRARSSGRQTACSSPTICRTTRSGLPAAS